MSDLDWYENDPAITRGRIRCDVDCFRIGEFGVHEKLDEEGVFVITEETTGQRMDTAIGGPFDHRGRALELAEKCVGALTPAEYARLYRPDTEEVGWDTWRQEFCNRLRAAAGLDPIDFASEQEPATND